MLGIKSLKFILFITMIWWEFPKQTSSAFIFNFSLCVERSTRRTTSSSSFPVSSDNIHFILSLPTAISFSISRNFLSERRRWKAESKTAMMSHTVPNCSKIMTLTLSLISLYLHESKRFIAFEHHCNKKPSHVASSKPSYHKGALNE